jgi:hypothetical protein
MPDPDRMVPLGTLPDLDFSTPTPRRVDREAHRDHDTMLFPRVRLDLAGIRAARELLDDAEREIVRYRLRTMDLSGISLEESGDDLAAGATPQEVADHG